MTMYEMKVVRMRMGLTGLMVTHMIAAGLPHESGKNAFVCALTHISSSYCMVC